MTFYVEFPKPGIRYEVMCQGEKQKILLDILLRHSEFDFISLSKILDLSSDKLQMILDGRASLTEVQAQDLAQLFMIFLSKQFFSSCILYRNFSNH